MPGVSPSRRSLCWPCVGICWHPVSGATPPPLSPYFGQYKDGVMDFVWNYIDMRQSNITRSDKYFHCKANREAAQRGRGGRSAACDVSNARENV